MSNIERGYAGQWQGYPLQTSVFPCLPAGLNRCGDVVAACDVSCVENMRGVPPTLQTQPTDFLLNHLTLGCGKTAILRDVHGGFTAGTMTAIVGPNGAGKSALLKGLLGLLRPLRGTVESRYPRSALGYLAHASEIGHQLPVRVEDFVAVGLWSRIGGLRAAARTLARRVDEAIFTVGLKDHASRSISELSRGQFQRMRFARLLTQDPSVILLDEPFFGVDEPTAFALLQLIHSWHGQGKTVIAVLHDRQLVRMNFPQALVLAGRVLAWGDTHRILDGSELSWKVE